MYTAIYENNTKGNIVIITQKKDDEVIGSNEENKEEVKKKEHSLENKKGKIIAMNVRATKGFRN